MAMPRSKVIAENQETIELQSTNDNKNIVQNIEEKSHVSNYHQNFNDETATASVLPLLNNDATLLPGSRNAVRCPLWNQVIAASPCILLTFVSGLAFGFASVLLPHLMKAEPPVDQSTISWIVAILWVPIVPGCLISGCVMELFGRRASLGITCVPLLLGWILIASDINLLFLMIGRFFTGIGIGLSSPLSPVYIGETVEPRFRGSFLAGLSLIKALGILATQILGTYLSWQWLACIFCLIPILILLILLITLESPTWLIAKRRIEEGVEAYGWIRGYSDKANAELKEILEKQKEVDSERSTNYLEDLRKLLKPLFITTLFFILSDLSDVSGIMFYFVDIINKALGPSYSLYLAMLWLQVGMVVMSALACIVYQCVGRRPVCLVTGVLTALSTSGLSVLLWHSNLNYYEMWWSSWLTMSCLVVYLCAICIGIGPLPWVVCGEIFPSRFRGLGSGLSSATYFTASILVVKTAPWFLMHIGYFIFLVFGALTLAGTIFVYSILPETKGKSLVEIEKRLSNAGRVRVECSNSGINTF